MGEGSRIHFPGSMRARFGGGGVMAAFFPVNCSNIP